MLRSQKGYSCDVRMDGIQKQAVRLEMVKASENTQIEKADKTQTSIL